MLTSTYLKSFFRDRHARDDDIQSMSLECRNQTVKRLKDEFAISIQRRAEPVADIGIKACDLAACICHAPRWVPAP